MAAGRDARASPSGECSNSTTPARRTVMVQEAGTRKWWALGAIILGVLAVVLDVTVLSVALPTLATDLHASTSDLQWFSAGYALVLGAAMLPAGLLGDRLGRRKVLAGALLLFGLASAACAYSGSPGAFIAARLVLGLAGAGVVVMAVSGLTVLFSEAERSRAVGVWAAANFLALPLGPILGGWLLTHYWWGWVFLMNVPVAAIGLVAVLTLVPESRAPQPPGLDPIGIVTSSAGLALVTYGLIQAGSKGWGSAWALVPLVAGLAVLATFFGWERRLGRRPDGRPLLDPELLRSTSFTWGMLLMATATMALVGVLFTMPQYFQGVLRSDAMGSGLRFLPLMAGLAVGAVPADRIAARIGARNAVAVGFAALAAGLLGGAMTKVSSGEGFLAAWLAVVGAGVGLAMATAASAALSELPAERSGVGSAVLQAVKNVGTPLGAAIFGSALSSGYQARLRLGGLPQAAAAAVRASLFGGIAAANRLGLASLLGSVRTAFVHGMDLALMISAAIALAGLVLALMFLPGRSTIRHGAERQNVAVS
jgi:MFS transporter, DHA2 family, multidrug resistance protein